jgi:hypothetical protein
MLKVLYRYQELELLHRTVGNSKEGRLILTNKNELILKNTNFDFLKGVLKDVLAFITCLTDNNNIL